MKEIMDGLEVFTRLMGAMNVGPANAGNRKDGKLCVAQGGECRFNCRYYTPGMGDAKSWATPCADDSCPARCPYLQDEPSDFRADISGLMGKWGGEP